MSRPHEHIELPVIDLDRPGGPAKYFSASAHDKAADPVHRRVLRKATGTYGVAVVRAKERFVDHEEARRRAARIKRDAVENLGHYLELFEKNFRNNGGQVHWARTGDEAVEIILRIAKNAGVTHVVKSKSMATEEVHLNDAFEKAGIEPVETDLGEYICQLRHEPPYHFVTPVMHLTKRDIADTFEETLRIPRTEVAEELALIAREKLREHFVSALMGVTGANFLVADAGMIAITENEGNARLCFSLPGIHVALVGIEKVVPRLEDLALLWPMLATSGTGQHLTCYNSLIGGPARPGETDGPREMHVILMDNGRTKLLADPEQREAAQCIRCGACLNVCPIFKSVGGHSYATTYQGPIGSVITPHLKGLKEWKHLPYASSLCGNCTEVCPVKIDIHHHLLHLRRNAVSARLTNMSERLLFRAWVIGMKSPLLYRLLGRLSRWGRGLYDLFWLDRGWLPTPLDGWTRTRVLPRFARRSFRDWWEREGKCE